eukprot:g8298.t1
MPNSESPLPRHDARDADFRPTATLETLKRRARLLQASRSFFEQNGYWEVQTPLLSHDSNIDAHIEPFRITADSGRDVYLQTSPEFAMKRLLASGADSIFQIGPAFRRGESGRLHNTEFTIVEWYRVGDSFHDQMELTERFVRHLFAEADALRDDEATASRGVWSDGFERLTYDEAFARVLGRRVLGESVGTLIELSRECEITAPESLSANDRDGWLNLLLSERVEPNLGIERPVFLYDYPASQSALATVRDDEPPVAERFELYIDGVELCNGYQELTDPAELRRRIDEQSAVRRREGRRPLPESYRLMNAMVAGLPECSGVALGFDRLALMLPEQLPPEEQMKWQTIALLKITKKPNAKKSVPAAKADGNETKTKKAVEKKTAAKKTAKKAPVAEKSDSKDAKAPEPAINPHEYEVTILSHKKKFSALQVVGQRVMKDRAEVILGVPNRSLVTFQFGLAETTALGNVDYGQARCMPARLVATDHSDLKGFAASESVTHARELMVIMNAVMSQKKPEDQKKELVKLKEYSQKYPDDPFSFMAQWIVVTHAISGQESGSDKAELQEELTRLMKFLDPWQSRLQQAYRVKVANQLLQADHSLDIAIKLMKDAEKQAKIQALRAYAPARFTNIRQSAEVRIAARDIETGDESARNAAAKKMKKLAEAGRYQPLVYYALAFDAARRKDFDTAIKNYAKLHVLPQMEGQLIELRKDVKLETPSIRKSLEDLWKEKHGDLKGLEKYLDETYASIIGDIVTEKAPPKPSGPHARAVLCELFTNGTIFDPERVTATIFGDSAPLEFALSAIERTYAPTDVIVLRYHMGHPAIKRKSLDPLICQDSEDRAFECKVGRPPVLFVNGTPSGAHAGPISSSDSNYARLRAEIDRELGLETSPPDIGLKVAHQGDDIAITAEATKLPEADEDLRLLVVLAEGKVDYLSKNGIRVHSMVVRHLPGGTNGAKPKDGKIKLSETVTIPKLRQKMLEYLASLEERQTEDVNGRPITMLTAYDYSMARILDAAGIDSILVGDTLGMVVQGKSTTLPVTVDEIIYHTEIVARAATRAMVVADLPFMSFQASPESALTNAGRILKETGAAAVKLEGGIVQAETIQALARADIPVMGHLGMRPQSVHQLGGMGKIQRDHQRLIADAKAVEQAGAFAVVLELIPQQLAEVITNEIAIPTIGIGAGPHCDGQVLVLNDMLGLTDGFHPKSRKFKRGSLIYLPTDKGDSVLLLTSGRVKIYHITGEGKQALLAIVEPGELFGELAVFDSGQREEFAETMDSSTVVLIPGEVIQGLMEKHPTVSLSVSRLMGLRRKRVERRLKSLLFRSNRERLISLLIELAEKYGQPDALGLRIGIKLSHAELASVIGSTRETVTVILGELQSEGAISVERRQIILTNPNELAAGIDIPPPEIRPAPPHPQRPLRQTQYET